MGADENDSCPRCGCCSTRAADCWACGGGGEGSTTCCDDLCQDTEPGETCMHGDGNAACGECGGLGVYSVCVGGCDEQGKHAATAHGTGA